MARVTVEDCIDKVDSPYELVLLAKERTAQLNSGEKPLVPEDNDKNTVISLREIGEGKISIKNIEDSAINKLRNKQEESTELEDLEDSHEDDFDKIYKGEVSKSGTAILPSKRTKRMPVEKEKVEDVKLKDDTDNKNEAASEETTEEKPPSEENKTE